MKNRQKLFLAAALICAAAQAHSQFLETGEQNEKGGKKPWTLLKTSPSMDSMIPAEEVKQPQAQSPFAPNAMKAGVTEPGLNPAATNPERGSAPARPVSTALVDNLSQENIPINFRGEDILNIIRQFALHSKKNIIAGPGVSGKVDLTLRDVPFDEAFRVVLAQLNLVAVQKSPNVIEVLRVTDLPLLTQVFSLKYRFARDLQPTLMGMLTKKENEFTTITIDPGSNSVVITSNNEVLQKAKGIIETVDIDAPQIAIKARLIEVSEGALLNYGLTWTAQTKFNRDGVNGRGRAIMNQGNFDIFGSGTKLGENDSSKVAENFPEGGILDFAAVLGRKELYALLNLIQTDSKSRTLSEPMILTGNNKSSKIHVGQNLPVRTATVSQTSTVETVQYIPEGVDLDVTPIVSPGSNVISFKIRVGVSELLGFNAGLPVTTERVATTEVSVESGKTVVIGGLVKDKKSTQDTGVPFLKDIPILGWLFKSHRKSNDKTELLIFITPELQAKRTI